MGTGCERSVTYFQVGNGNCSLITLSDNDHILVDLCESDDGFSILEHLRKTLPTEEGKPFLSVLCVTHAHQDHIAGVKNLLADFEVGEIWYPNYDRFEMEDSEQSDDYKALHKEIERRRKSDSGECGDIARELTAKDTLDGFCDVTPESFAVKVLSPYVKDEEEEEDINEMSLVVNFSISEMSFLFPGDSSADIWCDRIIPLLLKQDGYEDWADADVFLASHHGSHKFFDNDREQCLKDPKNKEALDYITEDYLVVSAGSKFPTDSDSSGDQPPHYAAYKWYKKDMVDRGLASEDDTHPDRFLYTCEGHIRFSLDGEDWEMDRDWRPDDDSDDDSEGKETGTGGFTPRKDIGQHAPRKFA